MQRKYNYCRCPSTVTTPAQSRQAKCCNVAGSADSSREEESAGKGRSRTASKGMYQQVVLAEFPEERALQYNNAFLRILRSESSD